MICGFGRTGKMFALEHWGVVPDIMTVAKGISSSYLPLAATVVSEDIANVFAGKDNYLRHVFTSSGHPVSAAAALKNIEIIEEDNLVKNAAKVGKYFKESLLDLKSKQTLIGDVRGLGLLLSVELVSDSVTKKGFPKEFKIGDRLNGKFRENGLILRVGGEILNLGPPLCITELEVDEIIEALDRSLTELQGEWA